MDDLIAVTWQGPFEPGQLPDGRSVNIGDEFMVPASQAAGCGWFAPVTPPAAAPPLVAPPAPPAIPDPDPEEPAS